MNELASAAFRSQYAKLTQPTVVTVHGHAIGTWIPSTTHFAPPEVSYAKLPGGGVQARQAQRDALLGKINRSK